MRSKNSQRQLTQIIILIGVGISTVFLALIILLPGISIPPLTMLLVVVGLCIMWIAYWMTAELDRRRSEDLLRASEEKFSRAFFASPVAMCITTLAEGVLLETNAGFERIFGYSRAEAIGKSTADLNLYVESDGREKMLERVKRQGKVQELEVPLRHKSGEVRTCIVSNEPVEIGRQACILAIIRDISQQRQVEQTVTLDLRAVVEAADELIGIPDTDTFYRRAVELAREKLKVERCAIFLLDPAKEFLVGTYGTDDEGKTTDERGLKFSVSNNPELLTHSSDPWWMTEAGKRTVLHDGQVRQIGLGWIATTAIRIGEEPIGLFANDAAVSNQPVDPVKQESVVIYCSLLGNILKRRRVEEALRRSEERAREFQEKLKALHQISLELVGAESIEKMCVRAIELGCSALGYDRIGLLMLDNPEQTKVSKYGIESDGSLLVAHDQDFNNDHNDVVRGLLMDPNYSFISEDNILKNSTGVPVGHGWNVVVGIWNGTASIGWLAADNLFGQKPLIPYQIELLKLYGLTLGHLVTRKRVEEALRHNERMAREFQEKLKNLQEVSLELTMVERLDDLCQKAIELGHHELGFDRIGLLLYENEERTRVSRFGYESDGSLRAEHGMSYNLEADKMMYDLFMNRALVYVNEEAVLKDFERVIGIGWNVVTGIWDGSASIGWLAADNFFDQKPLLPYQVELLKLYSLTLGYLTKRKRMEEELRRSEEWFANIFRMTPFGISISSVETGRFVDINDAGCELFGCTLEEAINHDADELNLWVNEPRRAEAVERLAHEGHLDQVELQLTGRGGSVRTVLLSVETVDFQGKPHHLSTIADITERKRNEMQIMRLNAELQQQTNRLSALNEIGRTISSLSDLKSVLRNILVQLKTILPLDCFYVELYDFERSEVTFPIVYDNDRFWNQPSEPFDHDRTNLRRSTMKDRQFVLVNRTDEEIESRRGAADLVGDPSMVSASILMVPLRVGNKLIGAISAQSYVCNAFTDEHVVLLNGAAYQIAIAVNNAQLYDALRDELAERIQAQQEVRSLNAELEQRVIRRTEQLQIANQELEAFTYSVSHDLRAPLRAIDGFSRTLEERYESALPEKAQHYLQRIQHNARRMGLLIDDLLMLSRIGRRALRAGSVDMNRLIDEILEELRTDAALGKAEFAVEPLPPCRGDRALLKQVWINLIANAVKYSSKREHPLVEIGSIIQNDAPVYRIKDNGAGFDMQYADKLFGVFERLHSSDEYEGTGIGLATVRRIITRHGGRVWAESAVDEGAAFYFTVGEIEAAVVERG